MPAPVRSAPSIFAPARLAPDSSALRKLTPVKLAKDMHIKVALAPVKSAPCRSCSLTQVLVRSAPARLQPTQSTIPPWILATAAGSAARAEMAKSQRKNRAKAARMASSWGREGYQLVDEPQEHPVRV